MLPKPIADAIAEYDRKVAIGQLTYSRGEFADMPSVDPDGWVSDHLASHLPMRDITPEGTPQTVLEPLWDGTAAGNGRDYPNGR